MTRCPLPVGWDPSSWCDIQSPPWLVNTCTLSLTSHQSWDSVSRDYSMHPNTLCIFSHQYYASFLRLLSAQLCMVSPYSPFETHVNNSLLVDLLNHPRPGINPSLSVPSNWFMPPEERSSLCPPCRLYIPWFRILGHLCPVPDPDQVLNRCTANEWMSANDIALV